MSGFQGSVQRQQAPAVEGDFASSNPRSSVLAGEGTFVAGASGAVVGRFAWADANGLVTNAGSGAPTGFVHRDLQALIGAYLAESSMTIPAGMGLTLMNGGDYWVKSTVAAASVGQKAFASLTDGTMQPAAAGATVAGYIETPFVIRSAGAIGELVKMTTYGKP